MYIFPAALPLQSILIGFLWLGAAGQVMYRWSGQFTGIRLSRMMNSGTYLMLTDMKCMEPLNYADYLPLLQTHSPFLLFYC